MMNPERLNDDYDIDDMFMSKAALRDSAVKQAERDKKKAIQEHQRAERSLESCQCCFDNKEMPKHLIVALGTKVSASTLFFSFPVKRMQRTHVVCVLCILATLPFKHNTPLYC